MAAAPVEASLNYLADAGRKPEFFNYRPAGETPRPGRPTRHVLDVADARALDPPASLDVQGFELRRLETKASDLYDVEEARTVYFPEVEAFVARVTGAVRVHAFDHNVRCAPMAERKERGAQKPVKFAHNDYTERSGPQRVRDLLPEDAEDLLTRRFAVINVWKPIRGPVRDTPLAVCDAATIRPDELIASDLKYRDRTGEVYSLAFAPDQRWYYFPQQQADEALLLKCYDSATDGRARFTCYTAFVDPTCPEGAPARESIEVRTLAFF